jgi:ABC-2 type transport system permease protein
MEFITKTLHVAKREFIATVMTKAFLIGVLILPIVMTVMVPLATMLISNKAPMVKGTVAIIDRSGGADGRAMPEVLKLLTPQAIEEQQRARAREEGEEAVEQAEKAIGKDRAAGMRTAVEAAGAMVDAPAITPEPLSPSSDVETVKQALLNGTTSDGSRLAVVVIDPDAVVKDPVKDRYGAFEIFVKAHLDTRAQHLIRDQVKKAIINARLTQNGQDPAQVMEITTLRSPEPVAFTKAGEKAAGEIQQIMMPLAFMMLLWISVFTGGQFLMTSTIEEKSSRVMEVLLSAVSPMQLMTGKIIGQMSAGLMILLIYSSLGITSLFFLARTDLIEMHLIAFLIIFFFIAFFTIAAMMAAVGSAVTDIHEAQALMMPIMLVVMVPMLLMMPIIYNPNGRMATVMSFLPPISPFVMVLRLSSSQPPPMWQAFVAIGIGLITVYIALKGAAKVFRIGVLMYGKPPNIATLIKWIRMA